MMHRKQIGIQAIVLVITWFISMTPGFTQEEDAYNNYITFLERYRTIISGKEVFVRTKYLMEQEVSLSLPHQENVAAAIKAPYTLKTLLELLIKNDPSVKAAEQGVLVALGSLDGAKAMRLPVIKLETSGTYIGNPPGPIVVKKGEFGIVDNPLMPGTSVYLPPGDVKIYDGMEHTLYQFKIIGDIPLWTWGKLGLGIDAGYINVQAAELAVKKIKHEKSIRLRGIVETLGYLQEVEQILKLEQALGARLIMISEQNKKAGFITETDLLSIKINIKEIDIGLIELKEQKQKLLAELSSMTGLANLTIENIALTVPALEIMPISDKEMLCAQAVLGNYDLLLGSVYIEAKQKLVELARIQAKGLPDFGVHVEATYSGPRFPLLETDWARKDDYQVTVSIANQGNILGNPQKKADAEKAQAELDEARAQLCDGQAALNITVEQSLSTMEMLSARIEYALLKQELYNTNLVQKKITIAMGSGSEADFLQDIITALTALTEAYNYCINYRTQLLTLDVLIGTGTLE